ncbi:Uncharacterized protein EbC_pEb17202070 (plasmid) [Erwinia billingiae Eb661]|uniref:Uncharacterized protein n=1 Tax=Erwinia billingiae (strain Eb661) TaxID=634500 RepID=D8MK62_ERWBE|nr:hypothetical protein [Erwinia billingiae]CAX53660.1 Uncharacterized protein EbC_pEb17202070 [Erwinia billingiae Eb661]
MKSLRHDRRERLRYTGRWLRTVLLQTFVTGPALFFFVLAVMVARGNAGAALLQEAEAMFRDAPAGMVMHCVPATTGGADSPSPVRPAPCVREAGSRDAWVAEINDTLATAYTFAAGISLLIALVFTAPPVFRRQPHRKTYDQ